MKHYYEKSEFKKIYTKGAVIKSSNTISYLNRNGTTLYKIEKEASDENKYQAYSVSTSRYYVQLQPATSITQDEIGALKKLEAIKNENDNVQEKQIFEEAVGILDSTSRSSITTVEQETFNLIENLSIEINQVGCQRFIGKLFNTSIEIEEENDQMANVSSKPFFSSAATNTSTPAPEISSTQVPKGQ